MDPRIIGTEVYVLLTRTYTKIEMKVENGESNLEIVCHADEGIH